MLANRALARLTGEDLTGRPAPDWLPADGGSGEVVVRGRSRFVTVAPCSIGSVVTVRDTAAPSVLAHRASHDGLTGLLNQRAFRDRLAAESERSAVDGRPLSLVVIDLDHFKAINDVHGHPTGDRVLAEAAARIAGAARAVDAVGRIGGEEFAWLLADDDALERRSSPPSACAPAITDTPFVGGLHDDRLHGHLRPQRPPATRSACWRARTRRCTGRRPSAATPPLVWSARTAGRIARGRAGGLDALAAIADAGDPRGRGRRSRPHRRDRPVARAPSLGSRWPRRSLERREARLHQAARLHDVGKAALPDTLLARPGPLSGPSSSTCASTPGSVPDWQRACSTPSSATGFAITTSAGTEPATRPPSRPARSPRAPSCSRSPTPGTP